MVIIGLISELLSIISSIGNLFRKKNNRKSKDNEKQTLSQNHKPIEFRLHRDPEKIPNYLFPIKGGEELLNLAAQSDQFDYSIESNIDGKPRETLGRILDTLKDFADLHTDISPSLSLEIKADMSSDLELLKKFGFIVFWALEKQTLKANDHEIPWKALHLRIVSKTSNEIIDLSKEQPNPQNNSAN